MSILTLTKFPSTTKLLAPMLTAIAIISAFIFGLILVPTYSDIAVLAMLAPVAGLLILRCPMVGVCILSLSLLTQNLLIFNGRGTGASTGVKLLGMAIFALWFGSKMLRKESFTPVLRVKGILPATSFILLAFVSVFWSVKQSGTYGNALTLIQLFALTILIYDTIRSWKHFEWVIRCLVTSGTIAAFLTVQQSLTSTVARAGRDIVGNENTTAAALTFVLPLAFSLLRGSKSNLWRLVGLVYIGLGVIGIIFTYSRTSYVGIVLILGIELWQMLKARPADRAKILIGIGFLGAILAFSGIIPWDRVLDRSSTINGDLSEDSQAGRIRIWNGAILMYLDHPVLGVGYDNFGYQYLEYQYRVEDQLGYTSKERSSHSTVYGTMAELGTVGIGVWIWLNFTFVYNALWGMQRQSEDNAIMIQGVYFALITFIIYGFVSKIDDHKMLWVIFGMTEAARRLTELELARAGNRVRTHLLQPARRLVARKATPTA